MNTSKHLRLKPQASNPLLFRFPPHTFYPGETVRCSDKHSIFYRWRLRILASLPDGYVVTASNIFGRTIRLNIHTKKFLGDPCLNGGWELDKANPNTIAWRAVRFAAIEEVLDSVPATAVRFVKFRHLTPEEAVFGGRFYVKPSVEIPGVCVTEVPPNPNHFAHPDSYSRAKAEYDARQARLDPTNLV